MADLSAEESRRAHHSKPDCKARKGNRPLLNRVVYGKAWSRRSSSMVIINVRTAGALLMVIAARARLSKRLGSSQFNLLFTISKKVRDFRGEIRVNMVTKSS